MKFNKKFILEIATACSIFIAIYVFDYAYLFYANVKKFVRKFLPKEKNVKR
jgi:uncharacterized membrane protein required for colicin V production